MLLDSKCPTCSADLSYSPGTKSLECNTCHTIVEIEQSSDNTAVFKEHNLEDYLNSFESQQEQIEVNVIECTSCGAIAEFGDHIKATHCAFCDTPLVLANAESKNRIKPQGIIPFTINKEKAKTRFTNWLNAKILAPNDLTQHILGQERFQGVYLPYWTFDCDVTTHYRAQRGSESTHKDFRGKTITKVKWKTVTGNVSTSFDDVIVPGSQRIHQRMLKPIEKWWLEKLVTYSDEYLVGYQAESYQFDIKETFEHAKDRMQFGINELIRDDVGGDRQFIAETSSVYTNTMFKHIILPIWISSYSYKDKIYQVVINGQTGRINGQYPKSKVKVIILNTILTLFGLGAAALFVILDHK